MITNLKKMFLKITPSSSKSASVKKIALDCPDEKDQFKGSFYSQDGEDIVLASFYKEEPNYKGFYVDIGALHPYRFSNTQYFYERGWRGINVDATPGSMTKFEQARTKDINVEAGISPNNKNLTYYCFKEPALNSFDKKLSEKRRRDGWEIIEERKIKTTHINDILDKYLPKGQKIDFMNIDIEGLDFMVLKSLDWLKYHPDFILIEEIGLKDKDLTDYQRNRVYKFLKEKNYYLVGKTMITLIFKKMPKKG